MDEQIDVLEPPMFRTNGTVKGLKQAYSDGDWVGKFNLWIVRRNPVPAIVYQQRSPSKLWAPNMLDVTAGGQLLAGEHLTDGLREVEEELGKRYGPDQLLSLGRKLYVGANADGSPHHSVIDIYLIEDDAALTSYTLQTSEVYAICACPVAELLTAHRNPGYTFSAQAVRADGTETTIAVSKSMFPENWDDYHYKIAILVDRYFKGEKILIY